MATRKATPRSARRRKPRRTSGPSAIPPGFGTVTPYLSVDRGREALEFYQRAFGAKELAREETPDGKIVHGRLRIGDSVVMLSDVFPGASTQAPSTVGTTTVTLHMYCPKIDEVWARALESGATVIMPLDDQFWGERYGQLRDPFGHHWSLSKRVAMSEADKAAKRRAAMEEFAAQSHPGRPE